MAAPSSHAIVAFDPTGVLNELMTVRDDTRCACCDATLDDESYVICRFPEPPPGASRHGMPKQHDGHTACKKCVEDLSYIGEAAACKACLTVLGSRRSAVHYAGVALRPAVRNAAANLMLRKFMEAETIIAEARDAADDARRAERRAPRRGRRGRAPPPRGGGGEAGACARRRARARRRGGGARARGAAATETAKPEAAAAETAARAEAAAAETAARAEAAAAEAAARARRPRPRRPSAPRRPRPRRPSARGGRGRGRRHLDAAQAKRAETAQQREERVGAPRSRAASATPR